jgi:putative transposase
MRTVAQAATVAGLTGGVRLPAKAGKHGAVALSRLVDIGPDFEVHRAAVESVSVLFDLYDGDTDSYRATGEPGPQRASGWIMTAARFEVDWPTDPARVALVRSHFGARRKAYNWGLARVKADIDARKIDPAHVSIGWTLADLRKQWNRDKDTIAPWWADNSKEAYSSGLADLAHGLHNWKTSRGGTRKGRKVGFPRFTSARRDPGRVRFTTGAMRVEADRHTITLPVIGALHTKENTRHVQRHLATARAQILNMTLSQRWGRLFVAVNYALRTPHTAPVVACPTVRAGVDLGLRQLATIATVDTTTGELAVITVPNPAPLRQTLTKRRQAGRELSRRIPGSGGFQSAKAKLTRLDRRCVHLRREAAHQLSTHLASKYGQIVVEDLDLAAMKKSMGRRAFRRAVSDAALGLIRPQLVYKTARYGSALTIADRWYPSSQLHHGCTTDDGQPCRLIGKTRLDKHLACPVTGELVDRDSNAAQNLRDWPDLPVQAQSLPGPRTSALPAVVPGTAAQTTTPSGRLRSARKTTPAGAAAHSEAETNTPTRVKELRKESTQ